MNHYFGGNRDQNEPYTFSEWFKDNAMAIFAVGLVIGFIVVILVLTGVIGGKDEFSQMTERTSEGLRYDWKRNRFLKDDRKLAISLMKKKYELNESLLDDAFKNFTDFNLLKFIEDGDNITPSLRAKVRLMLHPEFRKYQTIVLKASRSRTLSSDEDRKAIHQMLTSVDIIMPPLETTTDIQLIVAWQNTKSPLE